MITDRHVAAQWPLHALELRRRMVREIIDGPLPYAVADTSVVEAARIMLAERVDALPVVDEERRIVGILTGST